jgi:hypothetical protein
VRSVENALAAFSGVEIREAWLAWPECNEGKAVEESEGRLRLRRAVRR